MRKSSKLVAVAGVLAVTASAALAGTASAAQPVADGYVVNENSLSAKDMRENGLDQNYRSIGDGPFGGSQTGEFASRVLHNGWYR